MTLDCLIKRLLKMRHRHGGRTHVAMIDGDLPYRIEGIEFYENGLEFGGLNGPVQNRSVILLRSVAARGKSISKRIRAS